MYNTRDQAESHDAERMGERKVINKYFPPDFDPSKIPKTKKGDINPNFVVRMMLPMSVRCMTCGEYMYRGKKFNSRKEDVEGPEGDYLGIKIFRFYFKCITCSAEFSIKTDPKNMDYAVEGGVSRNYEPFKDVAEQKKQQLDAREESEKDDKMAVLENKTKDSKVEMDILDALDEIRTQNSRNAKVSVEDIIEARRKWAGEQDATQAAAAASLGDDEEQAVEDAFAVGRVKRLREEEEGQAFGDGSRGSGSSSGAHAAGDAHGSCLAAASAAGGKGAPKKPKLPIFAVKAKPAAATSTSCPPPGVAASSVESHVAGSHAEGSGTGSSGGGGSGSGGLLGLGGYGSSGSSGSSSPGEG